MMRREDADDESNGDSAHGLHAVLTFHEHAYDMLKVIGDEHVSTTLEMVTSLMWSPS